ncbi:MAG: tRNA-dihydrouridine synthase family protein [Sinobacterium sp.]|nr:tRNA-dihydrouridine synthase family protein [Sinobacterium sp.]
MTPNKPNLQHCPANFIMLAPMEGIIDYTMREIFSAIGGIDRLVTEFIRVNDKVLPKRVFKRYCPELTDEHSALHGLSYQANNTPVYVQLLGDKPEILATNAFKLQRMGAAGIDLNFGCPSKMVNRSCGGSYLLQWPEKVFDIVHTVRAYVDKGTPVTAKIRLGYQDKGLAKEIVAACSEAGASEIAIHARTKVEGYKPPAHWQLIAKLKQGISTPIIANGEIWNLQHLQTCVEQSQCKRVMIGRGLVACPDLARIATDPNHQPMNYCDSLLLLNYYYCMLSPRCDEKYRHSLVKQWMAYLRIQYPQYHLLFNTIKRIKNSHAMQDALLLALKQALSESDASNLRSNIGGLDLSSYNTTLPLK